MRGRTRRRLDTERFQERKGTDLRGVGKLISGVSREREEGFDRKFCCRVSCRNVYFHIVCQDQHSSNSSIIVSFTLRLNLFPIVCLFRLIGSPCFWRLEKSIGPPHVLNVLFGSLVCHGTWWTYVRLTLREWAETEWYSKRIESSWVQDHIAPLLPLCFALPLHSQAARRHFLQVWRGELSGKQVRGQSGELEVVFDSRNSSCIFLYIRSCSQDARRVSAELSLRAMLWSQPWFVFERSERKSHDFRNGWERARSSSPFSSHFTFTFTFVDSWDSSHLHEARNKDSTSITLKKLKEQGNQRSLCQPFTYLLRALH